MVGARRSSVKIPKLAYLLSHMLHGLETERQKVRETHRVKLLRTLRIHTVLALRRLFGPAAFLRNYIILFGRTVHWLRLLSFLIGEILL